MSKKEKKKSRGVTSSPDIALIGGLDPDIYRGIKNMNSANISDEVIKDLMLEVDHQI